MPTKKKGITFSVSQDDKTGEYTYRVIRGKKDPQTTHVVMLTFRSGTPRNKLVPLGQSPQLIQQLLKAGKKFSKVTKHKRFLLMGLCLPLGQAMISKRWRKTFDDLCLQTLYRLSTLEKEGVIRDGIYLRGDSSSPEEKNLASKLNTVAMRLKVNSWHCTNSVIITLSPKFWMHGSVLESSATRTLL